MYKKDKVVGKRLRLKHHFLLTQTIKSLTHALIVHINILSYIVKQQFA